MKKLILMLLLVSTVLFVERASAQNATGNASDNGVPVPVSTPQVNPPVGVTVAAPALTVPTAPPVQVLSAPIVAPSPTITAPGVMPAVPAAPAPPPARPAAAPVPACAAHQAPSLQRRPRQRRQCW